MRRADSQMSEWKTEAGRTLLVLNRLADPSQVFHVVPAYISRQELVELRDAINDALELTQQ